LTIRKSRFASIEGHCGIEEDSAEEDGQLDNPALLQLKGIVWNRRRFGWFLLFLYAHRHRSIIIRGGWSHYTDTSEPVYGGVGTLQL
jgi:hypothetical protein